MSLVKVREGGLVHCTRYQVRMDGVHSAGTSQEDDGEEHGSRDARCGDRQTVAPDKDRGLAKRDVEVLRAA